MQSCRLYRAESEKRNQKKWHGHLAVQKWQKGKKKKDLPSRYISDHLGCHCWIFCTAL